MDSRKYILQQTLLVFAGQILCGAAMVGIFALLGMYDQSVLLGGIFGVLVATANFFFMAVGAGIAVAGGAQLGAGIASDKACNQDVKGGQATVQMFYIGRLIGIAVILFALIKSGLCNVYTAVIPLIFTRPILTIYEFFRKGDQT